ncbi:hypothetical protein AURDEDRAFT_178340 [Auricularia subglabra TFB-10046 SS5]|uniref:Uncharacterized protein n=1 Tax=Auricularia subglabra (strain TFB-10046 / SS5) TaxID=717982 RepID=J0D1V4_AURST|nr:hypothetical protein AURDEDRAFT_178340 [Auricularia subglabra TFB-10046 SS5]
MSVSPPRPIDAIGPATPRPAQPPRLPDSRSRNRPPAVTHPQALWQPRPHESLSWELYVWNRKEVTEDAQQPTQNAQQLIVLYLPRTVYTHAPTVDFFWHFRALVCFDVYPSQPAHEEYHKVSGYLRNHRRVILTSTPDQDLWTLVFHPTYRLLADVLLSPLRLVDADKLVVVILGPKGRAC